ncbi:cyclic lactone autoinducer peptide [Paenibacillus sp. 598K]|nr:cyclic lactone autoinducer peptide [Paenibacillus sp. 598K]
MKHRIYMLIATMLAGAAVVIVSTGSWLYINQPETPEELLRKPE